MSEDEWAPLLMLPAVAFPTLGARYVVSVSMPPTAGRPPPTLPLAGGHPWAACAGARGICVVFPDCRHGLLHQRACVRQLGGGAGWGGWGRFEAEPGFPSPVKLSEAQKGIQHPVPGLSSS